MSAASTSRAADDQSQTDQQKQNQQQAQLNQPSNAQSQAQSEEQNQQNAQQAEQQPNANQQKASQNESKSAENANERAWPAPQRYEYRRGNAGNQGQQGQARGQQRGSLGVNIVSSENGEGVTVMRIIPNTAAQQMGLHRRDRITSLNGQPVRSVDQFISDIRNMQPGQEVALEIMRNGEKRTVRGQLQGYAESVLQTQGPNGIREYRRFQGVIEPNQGNEYSRSEGQMNSENRQAGYEENEQYSQADSGDLSVRISRIERQLDRISQQVDQLRDAIGPTRLSERPGAPGARGRTEENAGQTQQQFRDSQQAAPSQSNSQQDSNQ
ncbi:MAG TPA: PDZ domain-containing protein [Lacipirellulaceae bacterium]|nr:PDZ domain-containing protein [Lacipirellulaceae bacterium]